VTGDATVFSVTVSPDSATLRAVGDTVRFAATARTAAGDTVRDVTFAWASGDTSVARVGATGLVTAVGNGRVTITATAPSGVADTAVALVSTPAPVATVRVTPDSATLSAVGDTVRFVATARTAAGDTVPGVTFAWASSDASVARVSAAGLATAVNLGSATIAATAPGGAAGTASVTVVAGPTAVSFGVVPEGVSLAGVGSHAALHAVDAATQGPVTGAIAWTSLNPAVATVDGAGVVTAVAAGQVTVGATANGVTAYALVTVSVPAAAAVTRWTRMVSDTTRNYTAIWGASATDVYATDSRYGGLWHYDGSTWSPVATGGVGYGMGTRVVGVWGASAFDLFVVGFTSHYDGTYTYVYMDERVFRWNGSAWTWSTVSSTLEAPGALSLWGASPRDVFVSRIFGQPVLVFDGLQWAATACTGSPQACQMWGMWGTSAKNVYAVSNARTINRYDGSAWSPMTSALTQYPSGFWGTSATNVFAVGDAGTILHYDGSSWSPMVSGTTQNLYGIWGASATNVYAVGFGGTILHYDGSTWSPMTSGTTADLYGIWGTTPTTVFVVGTKGTILQGTP
jgi:uncharacterized protein YjdB